MGVLGFRVKASYITTNACEQHGGRRNWTNRGGDFVARQPSWFAVLLPGQSVYIDGRAVSWAAALQRPCPQPANGRRCASRLGSSLPPSRRHDPAWCRLRAVLRPEAPRQACSFVQRSVEANGPAHLVTRDHSTLQMDRRLTNALTCATVPQLLAVDDQAGESSCTWRTVHACKPVAHLIGVPVLCRVAGVTGEQYIKARHRLSELLPLTLVAGLWATLGLRVPGGSEHRPLAWCFDVRRSQPTVCLRIPQDPAGALPS